MAAKKKDMFQAEEPEKPSRFKARTEERVVDLNDEAERRAERLRHEPDEKVERKLKNAGGWAVWFSFLLAATWLGGVGAFLVGYYTPEQLIALPAPIALGGGLMIFGGGVMILFMGSRRHRRVHHQQAGRRHPLRARNPRQGADRHRAASADA